MKPDPWSQQTGRDLDPLPIQPGNWKRIAACLNIWNDVEELRANFETWYPHVDIVIAVDGAYEGMGGNAGLSTDGTREFLQSLGKVQLVDAAGLVQHEKRSVYFRHAQEGDLLWRIDADEKFENAAAIRETPHLNVGWIRYTAPIYRREQGIPAVFAYRPGLHYRDRHHWVYDGDRLISTQQLGGAGLLHRLLPISMHNSRGIKRPVARIILAKNQRKQQSKQEAAASSLRIAGHEPLRVVQISPIDPGIVIARLHSAINTTSPHSSVMATDATAKPEFTQPPRQLDLRKNRYSVRDALNTADIVHVHLNYDAFRRTGYDWTGLVGKIVIHHHGTMYRRAVDDYRRIDTARASLRLVSNLELLQYDSDLIYLPNPVPFARYRLLGDAARPRWKKHSLRIAHSPTKRANKGTETFLRVCDHLNQKGLAIEPVLIERMAWADALQLKASCHAAFDSFWLGMQCSGLEAAAMGQPVIAGDSDCKREYEARFGGVPYTWANDEAELSEAIERLATDHQFFEDETERVGAHVLQHHDYASVATSYLDILDAAMNWRSKLTLGRPVAA